MCGLSRVVVCGSMKRLNGESWKIGLSRASFGASLGVLVIVVLLVSVFFVWRNDWRIPNASGVVTSSGLMAYFDNACTKPVSSVEWGNVTVNSLSRVIIYVKNTVQTPLVLSMNTSEWSSLDAERSIFLIWDGGGKVVQPHGVVKVTLGLYVSSSIAAVTDFDFLINIGVGFSKTADVNRDGRIDVSDFALLGISWNTAVGSSRYNYNCDFNSNGKIDASDAAAFVLQRNAR